MAGFFLYNYRKQGPSVLVRFRTYFNDLLDYLLIIGTTNRTQNSEGTGKMYKIKDFMRFLFSFFSYSIIFIFLFSALVGSQSSHAAEIKLAGCDMEVSTGSGKPIVICSNPRYTKEDIKAFDQL